METSKVISIDKATVIIQVNTHEDHESIIFINGKEAGGTNKNAALKGFFKAQPKAFGIAQIMIGAMVFSLGIVLTTKSIFFTPVLVYSGITYWGSFIFISAGSLSVAAHKKHNQCLVKASLGMNVISAVTAGLAIILMSIQLRTMTLMHEDLRSLHSQGLRIVSIMLVFTVPQFIISICISGFACKATCNRKFTVVNVALN